MARVVTYIDGFNLYFGLRSSEWKKYYWLDLERLSQSLLQQDQKLERVHYFTARIRSNGRNEPDRQRQNTYLEALETRNLITSHFGHFLEKTAKCRSCGDTWTTYEEKMTDVNIATQLLLDAFNNTFDVAILVSGDSDLTMPVRQLHSVFPSKRVVVAFPPNRHSSELKNVAKGCFTIGEAKIRQSQFNDRVIRRDGFELVRPNAWRHTKDKKDKP